MVHPLHHGAVTLLRELHDVSPLRPWPMDFGETGLYERLREIMRAANLPDDRRYRFHIFRKSVATMCAIFGGDVDEAIGWRNAAMKDKYIDRTQSPRIGPSSIIPWIGDLKPEDDDRPRAA